MHACHMTLIEGRMIIKCCLGHGADTKYIFPRTAKLPYMGIMAKRIRCTHVMEYGEAIKLFKAHVYPHQKCYSALADEDGFCGFNALTAACTACCADGHPRSAD